jgi:hypothetical protein
MLLHPPDIHLMIGGAAVLFRGGNWSAPFPDIAIFDATYVREDIFAGDLVDTEHRRNLYTVIVGAQGVTLAARVNELDRPFQQTSAPPHLCPHCDSERSRWTAVSEASERASPST